MLAPKPFQQAEERKRSSLAPTLFEQLYGKDAELLLQDVPDHPEEFSSDEISLAWQILGGTKKLTALDQDERRLLDHITDRMVEGRYKKPATTKLRERRIEDDEGPPGDPMDEMTAGQIESA